VHISTRGAAAALRPPPHSSVLATDADIPKLNKDPVKSIRPSCRMCGKNGHSESACSHNEGATCPQRLGLEVVPVDNDSSGGDKAHDLLRNDFYSDLLRRAQRGEFLVIWAAPPCATFSICRFLPTRTLGGGPPIIRRRQEGQVIGARDVPQKNRRELRISNELTSRTIAILRAGFDAGSECGLENPVDAGDEDHPEYLVDREHAPLWLMPEVIAFKRHAGCREVTFPQCSFGFHIP